MNKTKSFRPGDRVWWPYRSTGIIDRGIIEWIQGDLMSIRLPDEGTCKVSIAAGIVDGQWLVHRSYERYKEPLHHCDKGYFVVPPTFSVIFCLTVCTILALWLKEFVYLYEEAKNG